MYNSNILKSLVGELQDFQFILCLFIQFFVHPKDFFLFVSLSQERLLSSFELFTIPYNDIQ